MYEGVQWTGFEAVVNGWWWREGCAEELGGGGGSEGVRMKERGMTAGV
jgi:hypothetical protein